MKASAIPRRITPEAQHKVPLQPLAPSVLNVKQQEHAGISKASPARVLPKPSRIGKAKPKSLRKGVNNHHIRNEEPISTQLREKQSVPAQSEQNLKTNSKSQVSHPPKKKIGGDSAALLAFSSRQAEEIQAAEGSAITVNEAEIAASTKRIKVYLRVRPVDEKDRDQQTCLDLDDEADTPTVTVQDCRPGVPAKTYSFNRVFDEKIDNEEVYRVTCKPLLDAVMNGFNGTLLAYGQTGSGKTHTMGSMATYCPGKGYQSAARGMIPMVIEHAFERIQLDAKHKYKISFSYVQIYQDDVYDLLCHDPKFSDPVPIREHPDKGVYLEGLSEFVVQSPQEVNSLLSKGRRRLVVAETKMNRHSSRSHALCFITIECILEENKNTMDDPLAKKDLVVKGKITLCDLAGSERIKRSESTGDRLAEAQHINSSLHELGNVVSSLAMQSHHVPFRNCALTRILQESLGGNCKTSLIVCASPLMKDESETKGTIGFGQRAMSVVQNARINVQLDYRHLANDLARQLEHKEAIWDRLEGKLRRRIAALEKEHVNAMEKQREEFEAAQFENESRFQSLQESMTITSAEMASQHADKIDALRQEFEIQVQELVKKEHNLQQNIKDQALQAAKEMAQRRQGRKQAEKQLTDELNCAKEECESLRGLVENLQKNVRDVQDEMQNAVKTERETANKTLEASLSEKEHQFNQYKVEVQETISDLSRQLAESMAEHAMESATKAHDHAAELTNLQDNHSVAMDAATAEIMALRKELETLQMRIDRPKVDKSTECVGASQVTNGQQTDIFTNKCDGAAQTNVSTHASVEIQVSPQQIATDYIVAGFYEIPHAIAMQDEATTMLRPDSMIETASPAPKTAWQNSSTHDTDTGFPQPVPVKKTKKKHRVLLCC